MIFVIIGVQLVLFGLLDKKSFNNQYIKRHTNAILIVTNNITVN